MAFTWRSIPDERGIRRTERGMVARRTYLAVYTGGLSGTSWTNFNEDTVRLDPGCPRIGDWYSDAYRELTIVDVDVSYVGNEPHIFYVTVEYSSLGNQGYEDKINPLERPAKFMGYRWATHQRMLEGHRTPDMSEEDDPLPVRTSSFEHFENPVMEEIIEPILLIRRNEASPWDLEKAARWRGAVNSKKVFLYGGEFAEFTVRIAEITPEIKYEAATVYFAVTYAFHVSDSHLYKRFDVGTREVAEDNGVFYFRPITQGLNEPVKKPVALDGNGHVASDPRKPAILTFYPKLLDFEELGLPSGRLKPGIGGGRP